MAKSWDEVRSSPEYLNAPEEERIAVHQDYFAKVVAPQVKARGEDSIQDVYRDYMNNTEITPYYNHESNANMTFSEWNKNQMQQIEDLAAGGYAATKKALGMNYNKADYDEGRRAIGSPQGKVVKEEAAVLAAIAAPEAIAAIAPEAATAAFLAEGATWGSRALRGGEAIAENVASSGAYQMVDKGKIDPLQTAIDTGVGLGFQGVLEGVSHSIRNPNVEALADVVSPVYKDMDALERTGHAVASAEDHVHAVSQITTLKEILERAQKLNPEYTAADALVAWSNVAPEMHVSPIGENAGKRGIYDRNRQTAMQQVVQAITGSPVRPNATVEEMSWMLSDLTPEDLEDIHRITEKQASRRLNNILAEQRKSNKYTGRFLDLADTQRVIQEQTEGKPWRGIFSSDINSYGADILDELGVSQAARTISKVAGKAENLSIINKALRKDQANRIAEKYGSVVKNNLAEDIGSKTEDYLKASADFNNYERQNTIDSLAEGIVLRKRADAHQYGLENLENLGEQIKLARKGNQVNVDKFTNAMYNSQMRKFVENQGEEALTRAQNLKDTARQVKLMGNTAGSGSPWTEGLNIGGLGLIALDEAGEQVGKSVLGAGASAVGTAMATGYSLKRVIDGAVNSRLAEASRLLRQETKFDKATGEAIQRNLKVDIDGQIEEWATHWHEENPGVKHIPLEEMHAEVDKVVRSELKRIKAGKDLPDWLMGNTPAKAAVATVVTNRLSDDNK